MSSTSVRSTDRVQSFLAAVDIHEPASLDHNEDLFRIFARHLSRSLDGRYLDRHPPAELIPAIEELLGCALFRESGEIKVQVKLIEDGSSTRGVLITTLPDQPFIVSVVRQALFWMSVRVLRSFQTVVEVRREATGRMSAVTTSDGCKEAMGWIEIEADNLSARAADIEEHIKQRLSFVTRSVSDYPTMRTDITACIKRYQEMAEGGHEAADNLTANAEFLEWILAEHFVILGTRVLGSDNSSTSKALGTGHEENGGGIPLESNDKALIEQMPQAPHLWVRKSQTESWIYRVGHLDHVFAQLFDDSGAPSGVLLIEGLFSFQALAQARGQIPLLRNVLHQLIAELQAEEGTHRHRSIRKAFNSLPLEYLFALSPKDIRSLVEQLLDADSEAGVQVQITVVQEQFGFAFIVLPRSYYSDDLRGEVRNLLRKRFESRSIDDGVYSGSDDTVAIHYFLTGTKSLSATEREAIRTEIEQAAQPWSARLKDELFARLGEEKARPLYSLYRDAFPRRYREETSVARAVKDIELLEGLSEDNPFACEVFREKQDKRLGITRLRIVERKASLLSDILPILDYLGLIVIDQYPTTVTVSGRPESVVSTFRLRGVKNMNVDLMNRRNRLSAAIRSANLGAMDNDPLNRLLLRADIPWTYVTLIRSYHLYARQVGSPYGLEAVLEALERNSDVVRSLTEYFRIKFDPSIDGLDPDNVCDKRRDLIERSERTLQAQLARIADLNSDQIIRTFFNLIQATLRTNFYNRDPYNNPQVVLKFNPSVVDRMPEPRPYREIYVHHPKVAGLHLRGGPVARGGIRWSDRRLDFRTEVLGLMHTQNLKNVVIVPRGAKGAFIVRETYETPEERRSAAEAGYKIFINGLLEVTDNLVDGEPVPPGSTLRYDDSDHYLVVAADKGTAHLSDTANGIGEDRGFWLGDAFASGGSNGYDHKVDGVTAKGAWECVKRHFREMGLHPEKDKIRVIGIGDMSGDVFGNGMLLSQTMQLVAAFDHRHIFIDPDPDPAKSWDARKMLFEKPRSNWMDYPQDVMSEGGGIYPRGAKSITLSEEARKALGITIEEMSGPDLIQHILAAPSDLLWNGGIGTYIKSDKESNIDAGDPPNDSVRINASRVRAKVMGEGGNLGITSKGRCQLASQGVRLNTDAIDNSGGVDLSDHEVNIKILLGLPLEREAIDQERRDFLLHDVRAGVNETVLMNNWIQSRMLSLDQLRSQRDLPRFQRALDHLSDELSFKRTSLNLPGDPELEIRIQRGEGLYRPELAVLASHAKLFMRQALATSPEFSIERLSEYLLAYFPDALVTEFKDDILNHPLGLDIAHAMFTNAVLGDAGCSWLTEMVTQTGEEPANILTSYIDASNLLGTIALKKAITDVETTLESTIEYLIRLQIEQALERATGWLLRRSIEDYEEFSKTFEKVLSNFHELLPEHDEEARLASAADLQAAGMPEDAATDLSRFEHLDEILDVTRLIMSSNASPVDAAQAFYLAGDQTGLLKLIRSSEQSYNTSKLEKPARAALRDLLRSHQVGIARRILKAGAQSSESSALLEEIQSALSSVTRGRLDLSTLVISADRVGRYTEG